MWGTAYDGDTWETPALMQYFVDGTPGDGDMPGRIEFQTQADGAAVNPEATTPELVIKNSGNIGVSIAAPSAKLHVSNADAADSFRVDDVAGDTSPFVIAADGNVGIGIANPDELLDIGADAEKGLSVQVSTSGDPNWNPYIQTKRSRGTMASPTAVQNGDMLRLPPLTAHPLGIANGHPRDANVDERLANHAELGRLNDGQDHSHD